MAVVIFCVVIPYRDCLSVEDKFACLSSLHAFRYATHHIGQEEVFKTMQNQKMKKKISKKNQKKFVLSKNIINFAADKYR